MSDPYASTTTFVALVIGGGLLFARSFADAVRDADWWVIVRGLITARRDRLARRWREARR